MFDVTKNLTLPLEAMKKAAYGSCTICSQTTNVEAKLESAISAGREKAHSKKHGVFPKDMKVRLGSICTPTCTTSVSMLFTHSAIGACLQSALILPYEALISKNLYVHHLNINIEAANEICKLEEGFRELSVTLKK